MERASLVCLRRNPIPRGSFVVFTMDAMMHNDELFRVVDCSTLPGSAYKALGS